ncbi:MAG: TetR/AcrR family transcriptional regulator [Deltaproteobacteria bacterium]|nr:TetR/AcrR family transcriptional regulator [Candidatus Zymogenaceae bacterium]
MSTPDSTKTGPSRTDEPSTSRGQATKKKIIDTATRLIHANGYKNTSLEDILTAAEIKKGSFYFHFDNKEVLGHAVIDRFHSGTRKMMDTMLSPAVRGEANAYESILRMLDNLTAFMDDSDCRGGCLLGNMALEISDYNDDLRRHLSDIFTDMASRLEEAIAAGQSRGEISTEATPREFAHFIVSVIEGGLMLARVNKNITPMTDSIRSALFVLKPKDTT